MFSSNSFEWTSSCQVSLYTTTSWVYNGRNIKKCVQVMISYSTLFFKVQLHCLREAWPRDHEAFLELSPNFNIYKVMILHKIMFKICNYQRNIATHFNSINFNFFNVFNHKSVRQCTNFDLLISLCLLYDPGARKSFRRTLNFISN